MNASLKSESYRRITMQSNEFVQLEALVQEAEVHRQGQKTAEVQRYLDTHPALPQYTRNLTNEIQEKIIFHLANSHKAPKATIRHYATLIRSQIDALHE